MNKNPLGDKIPSEYGYGAERSEIHKVDPMDQNVKFADMPVRDVVQPYEKEDSGALPTQSEMPSIPVPGIHGAGETQKAQQEVVNNPWFSKSSSLVDFMNVMSQLMLMQRDTHYTQGKLETQIRNEMYEMGKQNAATAQDIKNKEAEEQYINASMAFFSAGMSGVQAYQVIANEGAADREMQEAINQTTADRDAVKTNATDRLLRTQEAVGETATRNALLNDNDPNADLFTNAEKTNYRRLNTEISQRQASRLTDIHRRREQLNMASQAKTEAVKQTGQGFAGVMSALIKQRQGELENLKQKREALLQSYNKYYDGVSKSKEDAKGSIDKLVDSITRTIADVNRAHQLGGRH